MTDNYPDNFSSDGFAAAMGTSKTDRIQALADQYIANDQAAARTVKAACTALITAIAGMEFRVRSPCGYDLEDLRAVAEAFANADTAGFLTNIIDRDRAYYAAKDVMEGEDA